VGRNGLLLQMNPKQVHQGEGWRCQCSDFHMDRQILPTADAQKIRGAFQHVGSPREAEEHNAASDVFECVCIFHMLS